MRTAFAGKGGKLGEPRGGQEERDAPCGQTCSSLWRTTGRPASSAEGTQGSAAYSGTAFVEGTDRAGDCKVVRERTSLASGAAPLLVELAGHMSQGCTSGRVSGSRLFVPEQLGTTHTWPPSCPHRRSYAPAHRLYRLTRPALHPCRSGLLTRHSSLGRRHQSGGAGYAPELGAVAKRAAACCGLLGGVFLGSVGVDEGREPSRVRMLCATAR